MKLGYYPGCSLTGSSREYNESVQAICKAFDIELVEINDWNCCGATAAHNLNKNLSLSLPARILALAEAQGLEKILVPCAACYSRLSVTQHELNHDNILKSEISNILEMPVNGSSRIMNVLEMLNEYVVDRIDQKLEKPFSKKVACYYGCLLVRPHKVLKFDRLEDPQVMDTIMSKIGASPIDWSFKTECCGAGFSVSRTDVVARLSGEIMRDVTERQAETIVVACPMCHSNLDMRRPEIDKHNNTRSTTPILYITQAIGLAIGLSKEELGLQRHFVPVTVN